MSVREWQRLRWLSSAGWIGALLVLRYSPGFERSSIVTALCFVVMGLHIACLAALKRAKRRGVAAPAVVACETLPTKPCPLRARSGEHRRSLAPTGGQ